MFDFVLLLLKLGGIHIRGWGIPRSDSNSAVTGALWEEHRGGVRLLGLHPKEHVGTLAFLVWAWKLSEGFGTGGLTSNVHKFGSLQGPGLRRWYRERDQLGSLRKHVDVAPPWTSGWRSVAR